MTRASWTSPEAPLAAPTFSARSRRNVRFAYTAHFPPEELFGSAGHRVPPKVHRVSALDFRRQARPSEATGRHALGDDRADEDPWLVFTGDSLLVGDVGRPDLHANGDAVGMARSLYGSLRRLLELPDHVLVYPGHYAGSVCGRSLSGNPTSTIGFERRHNAMLAFDDPDRFASALLADVPAPPARQAEIVAANRRG